MIAPEEIVIPAPELRGGNFALGACRDIEVLLDGPAGCIAGETRIYNPVTGEHTPVKELYEKKIAPIVQTLMGAIQAETPFRKGVADLYRVTLASGRNCLVTGNHLLLTPSGWKFVRDCAPGTPLLVSVESDNQSGCYQDTSSALSSERRSVAPFQQPLPLQMPSVLSRRDGENKHHTGVSWDAYASKEYLDASISQKPSVSFSPIPVQSKPYSECAGSLRELPETPPPLEMKAYAKGGLTASASLHPTTEAPDLSVSLQDAWRLSQTPLGSQERCSVYCCHDDVPPHLGEGNAPELSPSLADALLHSHDGLYRDDQAFLQECSHRHQSRDHRARRCYSPSSGDRACTQSHVQRGTFSRVDALCQSVVQSQKERHPLVPTAQRRPGGDSKLHCEPGLEGRQPSLQQRQLLLLIAPIPQPSTMCFSSSDKSREFVDAAYQLDAYTPSIDPSSCSLHTYNADCTVQWDTVSSIEYERTDEYFDLHVPVAEHYLAEGIWHHNTGKTLSALYKVHMMLTCYPGARALVARKTNTALSGSAMVTFRDMLHPEEGVVYFGGNKVKPAAFQYPNGSQLIVSGLDKPEKIKSFEFSLAYINEASECTVEDIEFVRSRLRYGKTPYHQLIMDTNPDAPTHWLNLRCQEGTTTRLLSRHEDNPRYYDLSTQDWTEAGRDYILGTLGGLTGVRLARLRYGIWSAAEGTVYEDSYDRARNVVKPFPIPETWPRYMALDFGYTHPFVCKWYAVDPDGRLYCYREIYKTKTLVEDHAKQIKHLSRWGEKGGDPLPREVIADHDAEDRETFTRHTGLRTTAAHKSVSDGIQAVQSRLRPAGDGKPRLMYFENCLVERDPELVARKLPTCTLEEFDMYVWDTRNGLKRGDVPVKEFDHGLDTDRYMTARMDLKPMSISYGPRVY